MESPFADYEREIEELKKERDAWKKAAQDYYAETFMLREELEWYSRNWDQPGGSANE